MNVVSADANGDYSPTDLEGNQHSLSLYRGQWIVLNFWATWCSPCLREMPELEAFYQNNRNADATVLGVTFEATPVDEIRDFVARLEVTYPILESGGDPRTPFGTVRVLPTTFLIDPEGVLYRKIEGPVTARQLRAIIDEAKLPVASSFAEQYVLSPQWVSSRGRRARPTPNVRSLSNQ